MPIDMIVVTGTPRNMTRKVRRAIMTVDATKNNITITPLTVTKTLFGVMYTECLIVQPVITQHGEDADERSC